jgi:hypothetical protein
MRALKSRATLGDLSMNYDELGTYWARYGFGVAWKEQPFTEAQRPSVIGLRHWREALIKSWGGNDPLSRYAYTLTKPKGEPIAE